MPSLNQDDKEKLLRTMLRSRLGDLREQSLIRQGRGWFHVSAMGHEALAVAGYLLKEGDAFSGYYRDRPIAMARGMDTFDLALAFFAKRDSASGGRQMPAHFSSKPLGIFSIASVVGASLLPATGLAWSMKLDGKANMVLTTIGDAGTRQGDFYESVAFAIEKSLPLVFLVEDNGIGISTLTEHMHPLALGVFDKSLWHITDGCDVEAVFQAVHPAMEAARSGQGPQFIWCRTERISSHSSADDHRKYRPAEELASLEGKDPLNRLKQDLITSGALTETAYEELKTSIEKEIRDDYERAWNEIDPSPADLLKHVHGPSRKAPPLALDLEGPEARMVDTINGTFKAALKASRDVVFFGQDIEDPKGGVFSLTKGLSTLAPEQVFNSPLAESTIIGAAVGMAAYGKRPIFEIQFTDYIWPGFNQLVTHLSTLHWRSNGEWSAPAVIYAPYGAYLPGGALWHSQTNEAALAHFPGLNIAIPSTPEDAAGLFWSAIHGQTPSLILIPKHLMWHTRPLAEKLQPVPFGKAAVRRTGTELTVVTWGNGTEVVEQALDRIEAPEDSVEFIDLRSVAPLDLRTISESVARTGRLLVVQEDGESCSVGQNLISRILSREDLFSRMKAAPVLVAKPDVNIGYNPVLEYAALPGADNVARHMQTLLNTELKRPLAGEISPPETPNTAFERMQESLSNGEAQQTSQHQELRVPILGEGITSARVTALLVAEGEHVQPDDPLCEVETDKALFPIESPFSGKLVRWRIEEEADISVGQVIADIASAENLSSDVPSKAQASPVEDTSQLESTGEAAVPQSGGLSNRVIAQLKDVIPVHMTVKAAWSPIRSAREAAKASLVKGSPTPTVMVAWCLTQAMKRHPIFCCTLRQDQQLSRPSCFDLGVAVALEGDALETAVIHRAEALSGSAFVTAYREGVEAVRLGQSRSKAGVPVILTSMGGFNVREAQPLVVPPAVATLFLGEAHFETIAPGTVSEQATLCLSFDHRWMNGAAGAQFLHDLKNEMEQFSLEAFTD